MNARRRKWRTSIRRLGYEPVWKDWDAALTAGTSKPPVNENTYDR